MTVTKKFEKFEREEEEEEDRKLCLHVSFYFQHFEGIRRHKWVVIVNIEALISEENQNEEGIIAASVEKLGGNQIR